MAFQFDEEYAYNDKTGRHCIRNTGYGNNGDFGRDLETMTAACLGNFLADSDSDPSIDRLSNAFTATAFLADQDWISDMPGNTLTINYDYGQDTAVPIISVFGIIIVSMLLVTSLLFLFIVALYASLSPRWTNQLDAFAMMKIGAAISDKITLTVSTGKGQTSVLDDTPSWIWDVSDESEGVGRLGLGAKRRLNSRRDFSADAWMG